MTVSRLDILVSELCEEIDQYKQLLKESQANEAYWKEQFHQLLDRSVKHDNEMMKNYLDLLLNKEKHIPQSHISPGYQPIHAIQTNNNPPSKK